MQDGSPGAHLPTGDSATHERPAWTAGADTGES